MFPTREETVAALSRNRDQLLEHFRIPTPEWSVTKWAWDKRNTYRRAAELGIPVPRAWRVSTEEDLAAIDGQPPFAIKPAIKEHFFYATKCKAWRADTRDELVRRFREAASLVGAQEVMVQELIPGDGDTQLGYCAFFKEGAARASMVVRRLRQHPVEFGRASTFVRTVESPEIEELSERFLRAIDYYGLVELEYKYDHRDGLAKLLDVNARTWGYHSLGQRAGVDFPYLLYADQVGLPAAADDPRASRACRGSAWRPTCRHRPESWRDAAWAGARTCGHCEFSTSNRYSPGTILVLASPNWHCCRIWPSSEAYEMFTFGIWRFRANRQRSAMTTQVGVQL